RGGGDSATATPRPGVTPQPTTIAPPTATSTSGGRTIRGGDGTAPTQPPSTGPSPSYPTATPGGSRTIRGSVAGSSAAGDGTGGADGGSRVIRGAATPTATVSVEVVAASEPTATEVAATATVPPPTATVPPPTATPIPPTATALPPTATPVLPTETPVPPTATEEPLPTETPLPPTATPTLPPYLAMASDNAGSELARYVTDGDPNTAWYADALTPLSEAVPGDGTPAVAASGTESDEVFLELDLGETTPIGTVRWSFAETEFADLYEVQVSLDGETWQTVTVRENAPDSEWQEQFVGASTRYVRFLFSNPNGDPVLGGLNEVEVYAA
ncbi:MAG TPA: discoidin domain-containing protein, partial [Thermomicrobiales bacterium]|nr:discoidin domain-containing protein [Thermomicrobiales bacterium]